MEAVDTVENQHSQHSELSGEPPTTIGGSVAQSDTEHESMLERDVHIRTCLPF